MKEDGKKLHLDYGLVVNGCVDLRHVLNRVRGIYTWYVNIHVALVNGCVDLRHVLNRVRGIYTWYIALVHFSLVVFCSSFSGCRAKGLRV